MENQRKLISTLIIIQLFLLNVKFYVKRGTKSFQDIFLLTVHDIFLQKYHQVVLI